MMQELRSASHTFMSLLSSAWTTVSLIFAIGAIVVVQVRNDADRDNHIHSLENNTDKFDQRIDEIDKRGTRASSERVAHVDDMVTMLSQRMNGYDDSTTKRTELVFKRLIDLENKIVMVGDQMIVVKERQDGVLHRLETLERSNVSTQVEVMRSELSRLTEQQSRIIQALDNTYNTLQEALRGGNITRKPTPGSEQRYPPPGP